MVFCRLGGRVAKSLCRCLLACNLGAFCLCREVPALVGIVEKENNLFFSLPQVPRVISWCDMKPSSQLDANLLLAHDLGYRVRDDGTIINPSGRPLRGFHRGGGYRGFTIKRGAWNSELSLW